MTAQLCDVLPKHHDVSTQDCDISFVISQQITEMPQLGISVAQWKCYDVIIQYFVIIIKDRDDTKEDCDVTVRHCGGMTEHTQARQSTVH